ncbi:MAG: hypothetical protein AB7O97_20150 [Planctomycetota bacterium]
MNHSHVLRAAVAVCLPILAGCSGGSRDDQEPFGGRFEVLSSQPADGSRLFLNDAIAFDFTTPVALDSATLSTVAFTVFDANGDALAEQPVGHFELATRPGDDFVGRRLRFVPALPTDDRYDDGGFRPGRQYLVSLVGGERHNRTSLQDRQQQAIATPRTFRFRTADGSTPAQLFRNRQTGGPRPIAFAMTPAPGPDGAPLGLFGRPPLELQIRFDQALNPARDNLALGLAADPLRRDGRERGRVFLRYDDPEFGDDTPIAARVELDNELDGAVVRLRPIGVLPNNAVIEVVVARELEDLSGESNSGNVAIDPVFTRFRTERRFAPQFDAVVERFTARDLIDFDAPLLEPQAEVGNGFVRASFDFEGTQTQLEYRPNDPDVRLDTDFALLQPLDGLPFNVSGGVFNFRNVRIDEQVTVRGTGTRPMVWLVAGEFRVDGVLRVNGGDGDRVNGLQAANLPIAGGVGVCGGGSGGRGSPAAGQRSFTGQDGFGPGQTPGRGGRGGNIACDGCANAASRRGSGGGGGSHATQGDPWYKIPRTGPSGFEQREGQGGSGCTGASGAPGRMLGGGLPGPVAFTDARRDNDYWGVGVDRRRQLRIRGELAAPLGGSGGGGGGDLAADCQANSPRFTTDRRGGGGGAGGGVLIVKALGRIVIGPRGRIEANGGNGGGGEQAGSSNEGGGGGGGSGGMVILMSATGIDIHAKGSTLGTQRRFTYAEDEFTFSVAADGGFGSRGLFQGQASLSSKYPVQVGPIDADYGQLIDAQPTGGFGGMGVVQLMAPPGDGRSGNGDQTNTILDDNIRVFADNELLTGAEKQAMLAWRGIDDGTGVARDDFGQLVAIGDADGDIRPAPVLLPAPFGPVTRLRSQWIDLGAARRLARAAPGGDARTIVDPTGSLRGPTFDFAALDHGAAEPGRLGYPEYDVVADRARVRYPTALAAPAAVRSVTAGVEFQGALAHRVELQDRALGDEPDRYSQYDAELLDGAGARLGHRRILQHGDRVLLLAPEGGPLPAGLAAVQVRARFFEVHTDGAEGLGRTYTGRSGARLPLANVRIGFAFHQDPTDATGSARRFPAGDGFVYDLADPAVREELRLFGAGFVQWDVQFHAVWREREGDPHPREFGPTSPRPELRFLRLPFRF